MMRIATLSAGLLVGLMLSGCQSHAEECVEMNEAGDVSAPSVPTDVEGLIATVVTAGRGAAVASGDVASMHYTGWLYDPDAADGRGEKFDSSRDRNQTFEFPLGEGRVIRGWDLGVAGMQLGEVRTLRIAPELGYGAAGAGAVIPPNSTLLFEVELVSFKRCKVYE